VIDIRPKGGGRTAEGRLIDQQKPDIFYNNAARFLQLSIKEIARYHSMARQAEGER
jgi:hypothetical protein